MVFTIRQPAGPPKHSGAVLRPTGDSCMSGSGEPLLTHEDHAAGSLPTGLKRGTLYSERPLKRLMELYW